MSRGCVLAFKRRPTHESRVAEIGHRVEFTQVVLYWCTRKYDPSARFESFKHLGGLIPCRFKAVPFITNNQTNTGSTVRVQGRLEEIPHRSMNFPQLTGSKQVPDYKESEIIVQVTGAVARIHDASQLLVANDKHLVIFPAKKVSMSTSVVGSSHTRR